MKRILALLFATMMVLTFASQSFFSRKFSNVYSLSKKHREQILKKTHYFSSFNYHRLKIISEAYKKIMTDFFRKNGKKVSFR